MNCVRRFHWWKHQRFVIVQDRVAAFRWYSNNGDLQGSCGQASFGHLMGGYDAGNLRTTEDGIGEYMYSSIDVYI